MADLPALRHGTRGDWTDRFRTDRLRGIRRGHADDARIGWWMLRHEMSDPVAVASMAEVAELRVWQADVALKQRRT